METKVTCSEMIKPSKSTSPENKIHNLCIFDVFNHNFFPVILFYPTFTNPNSLKDSLSETLTIFYPLAGRRKDLRSVSCNDQGVLYNEATVNTTISDFLNPPNIESLNQLLPCEPHKIHPPAEGEEPISSPHLMVQINTFEGGGVAIGVCCLHTIMDATSCGVFLRTWSAIHRNQRDDVVWPDFDSAFALFAPKNFSCLPDGPPPPSSPKEVEPICSMRRFVFTEEAMNNLRSSLAKDREDDNGALMKNKPDESMNNLKTLATEGDDNGPLRKPTRYQVLSSFIAKHMILAYSSKGISCNLVLLLHAMDIRRRRGEPLTINSVGSLVTPAMIPYENKVNNISINDLVKMTREKIGSMNKDLFLKIEKDPEFLVSDEFGGKLFAEWIKEKKKPISVVFTSWSNLGFNELDFGCGKPLWVSFAGAKPETTPNTVVLMNTSQGFEAWIAMPEEYLAVLEKDKEFLTYASINPTVSSP